MLALVGRHQRITCRREWVARPPDRDGWPRGRVHELADASMPCSHGRSARREQACANAHELRTPLAIAEFFDVAAIRTATPANSSTASLLVERARAIDLTKAFKLLLSRTNQRSFTREHDHLAAKKPPKHSSPSQKSTASPSKPPGTSLLSCRLTRALAAVDDEPRAQRDSPARTGHCVGHHQNSPRQRGAHCREHHRSPHSRFDTHRGAPARHRTHTQRPWTCVGLGLAIVKSITRLHDGRPTIVLGLDEDLRHGAATCRVGPDQGLSWGE